MAWPSKNPDDYLHTSWYSPPVPSNSRGTRLVAELAPGDWRIGHVPTQARLAGAVLAMPPFYLASIVAGLDVLREGRWIFFLIWVPYLGEPLARRFLAARMVGTARPWSLRFAPVDGLPWLLTLGATLATLFVGACVVALVTDHERSQALGLLAATFVAPAPAWLVERHIGRRHGPRCASRT